MCRFLVWAIILCAPGISCAGSQVNSLRGHIQDYNNDNNNNNNNNNNNSNNKNDIYKHDRNNNNDEIDSFLNNNVNKNNNIFHRNDGIEIDNDTPIDMRSLQESNSRPKYNVYSLPSFEIQLDIDLWTTAINADFLNHRKGRHLNNVEERELQRPFKQSSNNADSKIPRNVDNDDRIMGVFDEGDNEENNDSNRGNSGNTRSSGNTKDPMTSLQALKNALQTDNNDNYAEGTLGEHLQGLLVDYTTDYVTEFAHEALRSSLRTGKGGDLLHALDLRGEVVRVTFQEEETYFLGGGNDNNQRASGGGGKFGEGGFRTLQTSTIQDIENTLFSESSETFASLVLSFTGTAAILQGPNIDPTLIDSTSHESLYRRPTIGREELRLVLRGAFAPPDGPYQFLSRVLESSTKKIKNAKPIGRMDHSDRMEYDAALVLGGSRQVKSRTDLDLFPEADFLGEHDATTTSGVGVNGASATVFGNVIASEEAEKRESIACFLEGAYLVLFLGGFYIYASYKYRRMYLKEVLHKYGGGEGAILVKNNGDLDESGLFSLASIQKSKLFSVSGKLTVSRATRFGRVGKWANGISRKGGGVHSPAGTLDYEDGDDGFFEREDSGIESSEDGDSNDGRTSSDYCEESSDLEKGLKESYDESNRYKKGLDMNPIDADSHGLDVGSPGSNTMKPVDDEIKEQSKPRVEWTKEALESVVPIPANDSVKGMDDKNSTYHLGGPNGDIIVQRRYVQPASPFDVLYGAAFLHGEADRVEAQRRYKKNKQKIRASPSARRRKKKKKASTMKALMDAMNGQRSKDAIKPMMTISEAEDVDAKELFPEEGEEEYESEEEDEAEVSAEGDLAKLGPGELRHNPSPMSFYSPSNFMRNLSEKYNLGLFDPLSNVEGDKAFDGGAAHSATEEPPKQVDFPVEDGVVFRDFPRQDGTPCLIYDVKEEAAPSSNVVQSDDIVASQAVDEVEPIADDDSIFEDEADDGEAAVEEQFEESAEPSDDFATKMDRILTSKAKQIEERKQMELEMEAMRKEREERKRLAAESAGAADEKKESNGTASTQ